MGCYFVGPILFVIASAFAIFSCAATVWSMLALDWAYIGNVCDKMADWTGTLETILVNWENDVRLVVLEYTIEKFGQVIRYIEHLLEKKDSWCVVQ